MSEDEVLTILWNMRADYIKANQCGLATKGKYEKEIKAINYAIEVLEEWRN